jgi:hypothetical protein
LVNVYWYMSIVFGLAVATVFGSRFHFLWQRVYNYAFDKGFASGQADGRAWLNALSTVLGAEEQIDLYERVERHEIQLDDPNAELCGASMVQLPSHKCVREKEHDHCHMFYLEVDAHIVKVTW